MENESKKSVSNLQEIEHHLSEIKSKVSPEQDLPDEVDSLISEASYILSMVAHKFNKPSDLEKAKADEGLSLVEKIAAREERNDRSVFQAKTPTGQKTRTARSFLRRVKELNAGAERRKGEKIIGQEPDIAKIGTGVHHRSGDYAANPVYGSGGVAPVSASGDTKTYRTPHPRGPKAAREQTMEYHKERKDLKKGLSPEKMTQHESKEAIDIGHGWKLHPESKSNLMSSITHPEHGYHVMPLAGSNSHIAAMVKEGAIIDAAKELAKKVVSSKALNKAKHCLSKSKKMKVFLGGGAGD